MSYIYLISLIFQMRGSIPIYWGHIDSSSIKPKIQLRLELDPEFVKTREHFDDLFERSV